MTRPVILVVDDDPQVLRAVAKDLRARYGREYRIVRAESGGAGLEALDGLLDRGQPVALLLSDQRMPGMDGVTYLAEARTRVPHAKRALLTAYSDIDAAIDAINASKVDHYLTKPWHPPEQTLYPVLDDLLAEWRLSYRPGFEGLRVIGDRWSAEGHQIRDFLARNHVPYSFMDVEADAEAKRLQGEDTAPLVLLPNGTRLVNPSLRDVAGHVGLTSSAEKPFYDLAIVGAGPAGLATAVYGGSEGLRTVLIEREAPGGQAGTSSNIENYLGFPSGLSGGDLARRAVAQATKFGVEILTPQEVAALRVDGPYRHIRFEDGSEITCHALMLSMGVSWRMLPAEGAGPLTDRGVYYGAAMTEALNCLDQVVYTVGAGNSAGQAALHFAQYAKKVVMLVRGGSLEAKMSQYLVDRIQQTEKIEVRLGCSVHACEGDDRLSHLVLEDRASGTTERVHASYLFVFIGAAPRTAWLGEQIATDEHGFVLTGPDLDPERDLADWPLERNPFLLETNVPGVFASGDVRHESIKRVASAVGEGSVSVHFVHRHLAAL